MGNKKLLLIDDDVDLLESLKVILESHNFNVITASDKQQGLKQLSMEKPDLVILDNMMGNDLEGYGLLNEIRKDNLLKSTPVIMYSGMAEQTGVNFRSAVENEKLFPGVSFVDKREDISELIGQIKNALKVEE